MSKRSNWCDYDKNTRKYIKKRDNDKCVLCGAKGALQIMHVFISRAKGGKGCKENGVLGCVKCHKIIDNPIGQSQITTQKEYIAYCKHYLIDKENITLNKEFLNSLKYKKVVTPIDFKINIEKDTKKCKNCKMLVKNKYNNSTIPSYYCKYKKICLNKTTKACKKFVEKEKEA